jgi:DNA-binding transcriptional MerR regulator
MEKATDNINSVDDMLTPTQAAQLLGLKAPTLQLYRVKGIGPAFFKIGKRVLYTRNDISAFIQSQRKVA